MLEVVFEDSALGSMRQAVAGGSAVQEGTALYGALEGEQELTPEEEAQLQEQTRFWQQEEAARQRRGWAESLPMEGAPADILSFPLCLSVGEIREEGIGPQRQAALGSLMGSYPEIARQVTEELLERSRRSLDTLLARAGAGEAVRVWTSDAPDDACGLAWLAQQLSALGLEKVQVIQVKLPDFYEQSDGTVLCWQGWGEVEPWLWGRLAPLGQRLPVNYLRSLAARWSELQQENAPLRAVCSGKLVSVPESWYDVFLRQEIAAEKEEFSAAHVVGRVLGTYQLGIGDGELAQRLKAMVRSGELRQVTYPGPGDPIYHCRLHKTPGVWGMGPTKQKR